MVRGTDRNLERGNHPPPAREQTRWPPTSACRRQIATLPRAAPGHLQHRPLCQPFPIPPPARCTMTAVSARPPATAEEVSGSFAWFRSLSPQGRRAFVGAFGGYGLDAYDFQILPLSLVAISAYFHISKGQAGLLTTVTLVVSALGGILAGVLADKLGRARTLMITVGMYAL